MARATARSPTCPSSSKVECGEGIITGNPIQEALIFAAEAHHGQVRDGRDPLPYFTHPIEVLINLRHVGLVTDPASLCAALLHDVLEETNVDAVELETRFGPEAAALVRELTRREPTKAETRGLSKEEIWRLRAEMLLEEVTRMSSAAQTIKLADRLSNVREAKRTKQEAKLVRYLGQTRRMLEIVPRSVNPGLWDAILAELPVDG